MKISRLFPLCITLALSSFVCLAQDKQANLTAANLGGVSDKKIPVNAAWVELRKLPAAGPAAVKLAGPVVEMDPIRLGNRDVTGKAPAGRVVELMVNSSNMPVAATTVDLQGRFTLRAIDRIKAGDKVQVRLKATAGNDDAESVVVAVTQNCLPPTLDQVNAGSREITGSGAGVGNTVKVYIDDTTNDKGTATADAEGRFLVLLKDPVPKGARVWVKQTCNDTESALSARTEAVSDLDPTQPALIGLAPFGIVASQQAERFSQADPFGGFVIGYRSTSASRRICKYVRDDIEPDCYLSSQRKPAMNRRNEQEIKIDDFFKAYDAWVDAGRNRAARSYYTDDTFENIPNFNFRVQVLFEADGRAASAPVAGMDGDNGGDDGGMEGEEGEEGEEDEQDPQEVKFIASQKTIDVSMQLWYEYSFFGSPVLSWGWYASIGGSFPLSKNELFGEGITADVGDQENVPLDSRQAKIDNDGNLYYEGGLNLHFYNNNRRDSKLYIQAILALGKYEAFADLRPEANTKWRGIGKVRVFPFGLNRDFFARGVITPMFGVDLNAGKGPDQVKFFIGSVLNITKFIDRFRGNQPTQANP